MKLPIYQLDAFTDVQFKGNPAAVINLTDNGDWLSDEMMQKIAQENSVPETAFLLEKNNVFYLRWFSLQHELDLCGHSTLATAYIVMNQIKPELDTVTFETTSGKLVVERAGDLYALDFPKRLGKKCEMPYELVLGLGKLPKETYSFENRDFMLIYDDADQIDNIDPDFEVLSKLEIQGIIVSAKGKDTDYVLRYFSPYLGVNEDPTTGSAQCTLAPYWSQKLNKQEVSSKQLSPRGGSMICRTLEDRVKIAGRVVAYLEGFINI